MLDIPTARALLVALDRACAIDPALRVLRDALWDAIIDAEARAVEGVRL
jgi:hypothetical protein